jgi:hypothetical protein
VEQVEHEVAGVEHVLAVPALSERVHGQRAEAAVDSPRAISGAVRYLSQVDLLSREREPG